MREAAEVGGVGEFFAASRKTLVATGRDAEGVARRDGPGRALPQIEGRAAVRLDLDGEPRVRAAGPDEASAREPAVREPRENVRCEAERTVRAGDRAPVPDSWMSPKPYVNVLYCRGELPVS